MSRRRGGIQTEQAEHDPFRQEHVVRRHPAELRRQPFDGADIRPRHDHCRGSGRDTAGATTCRDELSAALDKCDEVSSTARPIVTRISSVGMTYPERY